LTARIVNGAATFQGVSAGKAGVYTLVVGSAGDLVAGTATLGVVPAPQFQVAVAPASPGQNGAGQPFIVTVRALLGGKLDTGYFGTVVVTSTDPQVAQASVTFAPGDNATETLTLV